MWICFPTYPVQQYDALYLRSFIQLYCGKLIFIHFSNIPPDNSAFILLFFPLYLYVSIPSCYLWESSSIWFYSGLICSMSEDVLYFLFQTYYLVHIFLLHSFFPPIMSFFCFRSLICSLMFLSRLLMFLSHYCSISFNISASNAVYYPFYCPILFLR